MLVLVADVVQRADVRMIQRREIARASRSNRCAEFGVDAAARPASTLIATVRSRRVSRARYTSPMPPLPTSDTIS